MKYSSLIVAFFIVLLCNEGILAAPHEAKSNAVDKTPKKEAIQAVVNLLQGYTNMTPVVSSGEAEGILEDVFDAVNKSLAENIESGAVKAFKEGHATLNNLKSSFLSKVNNVDEAVTISVQHSHASHVIASQVTIRVPFAFDTIIINDTKYWRQYEVMFFIKADAKGVTGIDYIYSVCVRKATGREEKKFNKDPFEYYFGCSVHMYIDSSGELEGNIRKGLQHYDLSGKKPKRLSYDDLGSMKCELTDSATRSLLEIMDKCTEYGVSQTKNNVYKDLLNAKEVKARRSTP